MTRKSSRVAFTFAVISAIVITCVTLYSLFAGLTKFEAIFLLAGSLVVIWAVIFSFFEVGRIANRSKSISGTEEVDPDAPRTVVIEPPTGHPYPHHEEIAGSGGFDQGQLTSRLPDLPSVSFRLSKRRPKKDQDVPHTP
ncbi:MAG TPA: hypothetical protein VFW44_15105 [Bryobacteraceae bacterium]|nr:hypothetical protein [Bryobacteraceae bacterium]